MTHNLLNLQWLIFQSWNRKMMNEQTRRPRVYFEDMQRKWSVLQAGAAQEMIDALSRHNEDADPLDAQEQDQAKAA